MLGAIFGLITKKLISKTFEVFKEVESLKWGKQSAEMQSFFFFIRVQYVHKARRRRENLDQLGDLILN